MSQELTAEERVRNLTEPTRENAIRDMFFSKLLFLTKNNKFLSFIVNEYMADKKKISSLYYRRKKRAIYE